MLTFQQSLISAEYGRQTSQFLTRALNAQCGLWASLQALGSDLVSAPHALAISSVFNSRQRALHGRNLTRDELSLPFERSVVLSLRHLFREIGTERFSQILCNAVLPFFQFRKLRL